MMHRHEIGEISGQMFDNSALYLLLNLSYSYSVVLHHILVVVDNDDDDDDDDNVAITLIR